MPGDTITVAGSATGTKIALAAQQVAQATANATYASPPVSMQAFDCSYFVWPVIKKINPLFIREPSGEIARDRLNFKPLAGQAQAGDIVYFPPSLVQFEVGRGDKRVYPGHVAIMLSPTRFLGMQTAGRGPQPVDLSNPWWRSRPVQFFRYVGPASGG